MTHHLSFVDSDDQGLLKQSGCNFFFNLKPTVQSIINPKTPRKHSKNLNKPIYNHKK